MTDCLFVYLYSKVHLNFPSYFFSLNLCYYELQKLCYFFPTGLKSKVKSFVCSLVKKDAKYVFNFFFAFDPVTNINFTLKIIHINIYFSFSLFIESFHSQKPGYYSKQSK